MTGLGIVAITYLGVVLLLGLVALLRAQPTDIAAVARELARWLRGR